MARENFTNFGTSALAAAITLTTSTSFTVTTGQGVLFPTSNFIVVIDTEVIQIASRSTDTFTVGTGGRGYDGSTAATHLISAVVQLSLVKYNLTHIWQNVADTYVPEVPLSQISGSPSTYDNEFEAAGSWVLSPSPSGGTTFAAGTVFSHLTFNRGSSDNGLYTAYVAYSATTAATFTCKVSSGTSFTHSSTSDQAQFHFFVSDQTNPSSGADTGTRFRLDTIVSASTVLSGTNPMRWIRAATDTTGTFSQLGGIIPTSLGKPLFLRLTYDGSGNWNAYAGDGLTYWLVATKSSFLTAPQSIGVAFQSYIPSGANMPHTCLVDYVRVVPSVLPPYAY